MNCKYLIKKIKINQKKNKKRSWNNYMKNMGWNKWKMK